jgi:predicted nucleotidyltransferase
MLRQEEMIGRVREACERDDRLVSALMYGSFALGEGDAFSDIEFYLFFRDDALEEIDEPPSSPRDWGEPRVRVQVCHRPLISNGTAMTRSPYHLSCCPPSPESVDGRTGQVRTVPFLRSRRIQGGAKHKKRARVSDLALASVVCLVDLPKGPPDRGSPRIQTSTPHPFLEDGRDAFLVVQSALPPTPTTPESSLARNAPARSSP